MKKKKKKSKELHVGSGQAPTSGPLLYGSDHTDRSVPHTHTALCRLEGEGHVRVLFICSVQQQRALCSMRA